MSKELYIAEVERLMAEGMDYDEASEKAYPAMVDRLAAMIDAACDRHKYEPAKET